jgi:hypothetical protein
MPQTTTIHYEVEHVVPYARPTAGEEPRWPGFDTLAKAVANAVGQALKLRRDDGRERYRIVKVTVIREDMREFDHKSAEKALSDIMHGGDNAG